MNHEEKKLTVNNRKAETEVIEKPEASEILVNDQIELT